MLADRARAIRSAVALPIQAQCEPPEDNICHQRMADTGVETPGMHLEAMAPKVRARRMPGKASVPGETSPSSFATAVKVFGRGRGLTHILVGLAELPAATLRKSGRLVAMGGHPFVVPFVPNSGARPESHPVPSSEFMASILGPLARVTVGARIEANDIKAGFGKCGAHSALSTQVKLKQG